MLVKESVDWQLPLVQSRDKLLIESASPLILNALHPSLTEEARKELLRMQFKNVTLRDAIASGNASIDHNGWKLHTARSLESFKGLVMEAALCRMCFEDPFGIRRNAYAWCTGRQIWQVSDEKISEQIPFITADKRLKSNPLTARLYDPASAYDLHFYRINDKGNAELATEIGPGQGIIAGIQIKAIQGNEKTEIIDKLLNGRYTRVVTMLRHQNGEHSYEVCIRLLTQLVTKKEITGDQLANAISRLTYPEALGIQQQHVDSYSQWLNMAYGRFESWESDLNVVETIGLEVISRLKPEASGILMPDVPGLALPPTLH